jgi:hypothetical protein
MTDNNGDGVTLSTAADPLRRSAVLLGPAVLAIL